MKVNFYCWFQSALADGSFFCHWTVCTSSQTQQVTISVKRKHIVRLWLIMIFKTDNLHRASLNGILCTPHRAPNINFSWYWMRPTVYKRTIYSISNLQKLLRSEQNFSGFQIKCRDTIFSLLPDLRSVLKYMLLLPGYLWRKKYLDLFWK